MRAGDRPHHARRQDHVAGAVVPEKQDAPRSTCPIRLTAGRWAPHQADQQPDPDSPPPELETFQAHCKECIARFVPRRWRLFAACAYLIEVSSAVLALHA